MPGTQVGWLHVMEEDQDLSTRAVRTVTNARQVGNADAKKMHTHASACSCYAKREDGTIRNMGT